MLSYGPSKGHSHRDRISGLHARTVSWLRWTNTCSASSTNFISTAKVQGLSIRCRIDSRFVVLFEGLIHNDLARRTQPTGSTLMPIPPLVSSAQNRAVSFISLPKSSNDRVTRLKNSAAPGCCRPLLSREAKASSRLTCPCHRRVIPTSEALLPRDSGHLFGDSSSVASLEAGRPMRLRLVPSPQAPRAIPVAWKS